MLPSQRLKFGISAPRLRFRCILALLGMGERQAKALDGFLRCCTPICLSKCPSCLTTQHYRDLLISDKVSVKTTMLRLSQKAPPVVVFSALLDRQGIRICHPITLADKVFANIYLLFHNCINAAVGVASADR